MLLGPAKQASNPSNELNTCKEYADTLLMDVREVAHRHASVAAMQQFHSCTRLVHSQVLVTSRPLLPQDMRVIQVLLPDQQALP